MKEVKAFWLMAAVFVLVCIGILLFNYLNMEREAVYYIPNDISSQSIALTDAEIKNEIKNYDISDKININSASAEELTNLPGIGEKTAAAIIAYREEHGKFYRIEEIMEVSGIGEGKFNNIKDYITVDDVRAS